VANAAAWGVRPVFNENRGVVARSSKLLPGQAILVDLDGCVARYSGKTGPVGLGIRNITGHLQTAADFQNAFSRSKSAQR
jgi:hypothetical protein